MSPSSDPRKQWQAQQAATRPLKILEAVSRRGGGATAQQVVADSGIPAPSVYRLVTGLIDEGYLERTHTGFRLGDRCAPMAEHFEEQRAWPSVLAALQRAEDDGWHDVVAAVYSQGRFRVAGPRPEVLDRPETWHASATGKLLVAYRRDLVAQVTFTPYTDRTHRDMASLVRDLDGVVASGASLEREEVRGGRNAVAVAVTVADGALAGALSMVVHDGDRLEAAADRLVSFARPAA